MFCWVKKINPENTDQQGTAGTH